MAPGQERPRRSRLRCDHPDRYLAGYLRCIDGGEALRYPPCPAILPASAPTPTVASTGGTATTSGCRPVARGRSPLSGRAPRSHGQALAAEGDEQQKKWNECFDIIADNAVLYPLSTSRPSPLPGTIRPLRPTARPSMASRASARRACPSGALRPSSVDSLESVCRMSAVGTVSS